MPNREAARLARKRDEQLVWLSLAVAVFVLAAVLQVLPGGRVALVGLPEYPLPHSCTSRALFGIDCPGCGLTRSVIYLTHGDLLASLSVHRVGWLAATWIAFQIPNRLWAVRRGRPLFSDRLSRWSAAAVLAALFANWLLLQCGV